MQAWLAVHNILMGPESRAKALASGAQCSAALRLRPLLTDMLMGQLPVLKDLCRVLDELMLGCKGAAEQPLGGLPPSRAGAPDSLPQLLPHLGDIEAVCDGQG